MVTYYVISLTVSETSRSISSLFPENHRLVAVYHRKTNTLILIGRRYSTSALHATVLYNANYF